MKTKFSICVEDYRVELFIDGDRAGYCAIKEKKPKNINRALRYLLSEFFTEDNEAFKLVLHLSKHY